MTNITEEEAKLYDRQIRLWGLDAQKRLRESKIMLIGMGGLGAEIIKNIALAGVDHIHLVDNKQITENDFRTQFLIRRNYIGKKRAEASIEHLQKLNPIVKISFDGSNDLDIDNLTQDWLSNNIDQSYTIICATSCSTDLAAKINDRCRQVGVHFFYGDCFGYFGFSFMDLGSNYEYVHDVIVKNTDNKSTYEPSLKKQKLDEKESKTVKKQMQFVPYKEVLSFDWSKNPNIVKKTPQMYFILQVLQLFFSSSSRKPSYMNGKRNDADLKKLIDFKNELVKFVPIPNENLMQEKLEYGFGDLSPVTAITGGIMAQEIIKAISRKETPLNNVFLFDGIDNCGYIDKIGYQE